MLPRQSNKKTLSLCVSVALLMPVCCHINDHVGQPLWNTFGGDKGPKHADELRSKEVE